MNKKVQSFDDDLAMCCVKGSDRTVELSYIDRCQFGGIENVIYPSYGDDRMQAGYEGTLVDVYGLERDDHAGFQMPQQVGLDVEHL